MTDASNLQADITAWLAPPQGKLTAAHAAAGPALRDIHKLVGSPGWVAIIAMIRSLIKTLGPDVGAIIAALQAAGINIPTWLELLIKIMVQQNA